MNRYLVKIAEETGNYLNKEDNPLKPNHSTAKITAKALGRGLLQGTAGALVGVPLGALSGLSLGRILGRKYLRPPFGGFSGGFAGAFAGAKLLGGALSVGAGIHGAYASLKKSTANDKPTGPKI